MADVLVIIVTWNGMKWLEKCIKSVNASTVPADIFIIDNGSTDGTVKWIWDNTSESVKLHVAEKNLGFGAANNIGLAYAAEKGYRYVYLLNQDAYLEPDTIDLLIKAFESPWGKGYGILSPIQNDSSGKRQDANFQRHCEKALIKDSAPIAKVNFVMAAHWMINLEALRAVGGFSPSFTQYGEDDNYIHRLEFHGLRCGVVRKARAIHDRESRELTKESRMRMKCIATVVKVSDPRAPVVWRLLREPIELLGMSVIHFSMIPLAYIPKLIGRYPELIRNRRASKKKGAFL